MVVEDLLGKSFSNVIEECRDNIDCVNTISRTITLKSVESYIDNDLHDCTIYFDLVDRETMNMLLIKVEHPSIFNQVRIMSKIMGRQVDFNNFYINITYTSWRSSIISYVKKNIIDVFD